ncbi:coiled-coil domain-containing protein 17 isoform X2 [Pipra filicauda]|uniref:Coiled-coil domain-containing protein 17 isoform X2 n=1 Tax=Pipra filicauda TaxID=649802 RepID=A0A7R5KUD5_9PASS|nr:coiled-coil domain-containing protein 17 isoform X2 [Pipra filicauda]
MTQAGGAAALPALPSAQHSNSGSNTASTAAGRVPDMGSFPCPRCRMAFSSRQLLRAHQEKLCLGIPEPASSCLHGGNPLPEEGAPGTAGRPRDTSVGVSLHGDGPEPHHRLELPGVSAAVWGQRGPGWARGAPLGAVLTPRERALLRTADPASRTPTVQEGEPPQQPVLPQGQQQPPQELLEAHRSQMAEIQARTQQLEQQREGLCRQLAALGARGAGGPQPEQGELGLGQVLQAPKEQLRQVQAAQHRATLHLDTLLPPSGPLAAEARALRLSYLRAGGHDPAILDQLLHLQLEATVLEKGTTGLRRGRRMGKAQPQPCLPAGTLTPQPAPEAFPAVPAEPPGTGTQGLDAALLAVELENWRLEDEVLALKVRRERRADAGSRAAQRHSEELARLQAEVGMLRCHAEQAGPRLPPPILPPAMAPSLPPALAVPELFMEPPGPALGPGSPTGHVPQGLPLSPFVALEDPPPAQEPPEQHRPPRRTEPTAR